jgi:hypothetical protein
MTFDVVRALVRRGVRFKIVGGVALNLLGLPRATQDLDIFVEPEAENIALLRQALHDVFDDPSIDEISAEDLAGPYPAIQYVPPSSGFHIDILSRLGEAFDYAGIEAEPQDFEGMRVPVATPRMPFRMKCDTVRMQDRADAERLQRHFRWEKWRCRFGSSGACPSMTRACGLSRGIQHSSPPFERCGNAVGG